MSCGGLGGFGTPLNSPVDRRREGDKPRRVADIKRDIAQPVEEARHLGGNPPLGVDRRVERVTRQFAVRRRVEGTPRRRDDPHIGRQQPVGVEAEQRRQQHPPSEVAGRAEKNQCRHVALWLSRGISRAPLSVVLAAMSCFDDRRSYAMGTEVSFLV